MSRETTGDVTFTEEGDGRRAACLTGMITGPRRGARQHTHTSGLKQAPPTSQPVCVYNWAGVAAPDWVRPPPLTFKPGRGGVRHKGGRRRAGAMFALRSRGCLHTCVNTVKISEDAGSWSVWRTTTAYVKQLPGTGGGGKNPNFSHLKPATGSCSLQLQQTTPAGGEV